MSGRIKSLKGDGTKRTSRKKSKPSALRQMELARKRRRTQASALYQLKQAKAAAEKVEAASATVA